MGAAAGDGVAEGGAVAPKRKGTYFGEIEVDTSGVWIWMGSAWQASDEAESDRLIAYDEVRDDD